MTPTPTRYYSYTPTYTPTYSYSATYTSTPTQTPTMTPTPECVVTLTKIDGPPTLVANGGIGHFYLKTTGCQDKVIVLTIDRVAGQSGSAIFADSGMAILNVLGDADQTIRVQALQVSDTPHNMVVQAKNPVTGAYSNVTFTNFWTNPTGQFLGPVPDEATGAEGPIRNLVMQLRGDGMNALGWAIDNKGLARGFQLMRFAITPNGLPSWEFKSGGPGDGFDAKRRRWARLYQDGCVVQAWDDQMESSAPQFKSLIPTAEAGVLTIYDFDAPSSPKVIPGRPRPKNFVRSRANFMAWSVYTDDDGNDRRASIDYNWFFRASWNAALGDWQGVPNLDNQVGPDSTELTYDLNPPPPAQDFDVQFFIPQTANNSTRNSDGTYTVDVSISGYFPDVPGDTCSWLVYLLSDSGDPTGNPTDPTDADYIPGENVVKNSDSNITVRFPLRKGPSFLGGPSLPLPAKAYTLYVVRGSEAKPGPVPFTITEDAFDHWKIWPFAFVNGTLHTSVRFVVYAMDASDNVVSRPAQPDPALAVLRSDIPLTPLGPVMGAYGEYYADTTKKIPGSSGFANVQASGGGVSTVTTSVGIVK